MNEEITKLNRKMKTKITQFNSIIESIMNSERTVEQLDAYFKQQQMIETFD